MPEITLDFTSEDIAIGLVLDEPSMGDAWIIDAGSVQQIYTTLTLADLAQAIGRTQAFISQVERGRRRLEVVELLEVCRAMGVDFTQFMTQFQHKTDAALLAPSCRASSTGKPRKRR